MLFIIFLIIALYFLNSALITQIFIPTAQLAMPKETPINEGNRETKIKPLTEETKTRKCSK